MQKTWCVAKPSSDQATLQANINYACEHVDCSLIKKGCPCFAPDSLINHASVVMNFYYQCKGRNQWNCHFGGSGLVTITDPSKSIFTCNNSDFFESFSPVYPLFFYGFAGYDSCVYEWMELVIRLAEFAYCILHIDTFLDNR